MIEYFHKKKNGGEGSLSSDYESIEMSAEKLSSLIDELRSTNSTKKEKLNLLANKYELLKSEHELFLMELEDKSKKIQPAGGDTFLIVPKVVKENILAERQRLEDDMVKGMLADKRKKVTKEDLRVFRKQFKESVANYEIVDFNPSQDQSFMHLQEALWRRLLLEYFANFDSLMGVLEVIETMPNNSDAKSAIEDKNAREKRATDIERLVRGALQEFDNNPGELDRVVGSLGLDLDQAFDKGYFLPLEEVEAMLQQEGSAEPALAYLDHKLSSDPAFLDQQDLSSIYKIVYAKIKSTIVSVKEKLSEQKELIGQAMSEYLMSVSLLTTLNKEDYYCQQEFNLEDSCAVFVDLVTWLDGNDDAVS